MDERPWRRTECYYPLLVLLYSIQRSQSLLQTIISTLQGCFEVDWFHFTYGKTKAQREAKSEQGRRGNSWPTVPRIYCHPGSCTPGSTWAFFCGPVSQGPQEAGEGLRGSTSSPVSLILPSSLHRPQEYAWDSSSPVWLGSRAGAKGAGKRTAAGDGSRGHEGQGKSRPRAAHGPGVLSTDSPFLS